MPELAEHSPRWWQQRGRHPKVTAAGLLGTRGQVERMRVGGAGVCELLAEGRGGGRAKERGAEAGMLEDRRANPYYGEAQGLD